MPRLIISDGAAAGLERCRGFLARRNRAAATKAFQEIGKRLKQLERNPSLGRQYWKNSALRELVIDFGGTGYLALYEHDTRSDEVIVVAFRHQREAGY